MILDSVKCEICGNKFKQINFFHLNRKHNMGVAEYKNKFPNSKTTSESLGKQISELTKIGMHKPENWKKFKNHIDNRDYFGENNPFYGKHHTGEMKRNLSENEDRNKKISIGQKNNWKANYEARCESNKDNWKKAKDNMGEELWLNGLREKSQKGFESVTKNGIWKKTKPEIEYENKLISENKDYIFNYKLDGKYFDFYIPSENKLVEIDGKFYHPLTIEECIYDFQKRNYYNDIKKNKIAKNNNLIIERIRV